MCSVFYFDAGLKQDEGGENEDSNSNEDDEDIDWGTIRPKEGQKPDWDKILPKSVIENTVDMPPPPPGLANLDPRVSICCQNPAFWSCRVFSYRGHLFAFVQHCTVGDTTFPLFSSS